jgi:hypothetical protein
VGGGVDGNVKLVVQRNDLETRVVDAPAKGDNKGIVTRNRLRLEFSQSSCCCQEDASCRQRWALFTALRLGG